MFYGLCYWVFCDFRESSFNRVVGLKVVLKVVLERKGKFLKVILMLWVIF